MDKRHKIQQNSLIFKSQHLLNINIESEIMPSILNDHKLLKLNIEQDKQTHYSPRIWKFNNSHQIKKSIININGH